MKWSQPSWVWGCLVLLACSPFCRAQVAPASPADGPRLIPKVGSGAILHESLFVSPREVITLRQPDLKHFVLLDIVSGRETPLTALTGRWAAQTGNFDPFALRVSPDGRWLLGPAGSKDKPTWLAASVRGDLSYEWPRDAADTLSYNIAWMRDSRHWVELNESAVGTHEVRPGARESSGTQTVARVYCLGADAVEEHSLRTETPSANDSLFLGFLPGTDNNQFVFTEDGRAWLTETLHRAGPDPDQIGAWAVFTELVPGADSWTLRKSALKLPLPPESANADECVLSPDGRWLVWRCYVPDAKGPLYFLLSRRDGSGLRRVYAGTHTPCYVHWIGAHRIAFWEWSGPTGCGYYTLDLPPAQSAPGDAGAPPAPGVFPMKPGSSGPATPAAAGPY